MTTLFETPEIVVRTNGCGELFVKNKNGGAELRIGCAGESISVTAAGYQMTPWSVNGLPAIHVMPR